MRLERASLKNDDKGKIYKSQIINGGMGKTLKSMLEKAIDSLKFVSVVLGIKLGTMAIIGISLTSLIEKENPLKTTKKLLNYFIPKIEMQSDTLKLNRNDFVYFVTNKNEEQGVEDIRKILNNSDYEEKWLYLPEKQKWFEIGFCSYIIPGKEASVSSSIKDIKKILEKNKDVKELIFYHNHSLSLWPSSWDFQGAINIQKDFPNYKIKQKICSKEGITEYYYNNPEINYRLFKNKKCP